MVSNRSFGGFVIYSQYSKMSKMEVKMEAFRCIFIISKKPILANRLFSLFVELLRLVEKYFVGFYSLLVGNFVMNAGAPQSLVFMFSHRMIGKQLHVTDAQGA